MMNGILNETRELIAAVGTEALKEKGEVAYNERKIKSELTDYADRELRNFENIDRNYEIDFESLKVYMTEKLMGNFKEALYGESETREQRKDSMLESLYSYVQADTYEKKQYVKKIFVNACKIIESYYETHILKSENLYLANKIADDLRKDIQKCADVTASLSKDIASVQNKQPAVSMVQHGDHNTQIGQVSSLTINN